MNYNQYILLELKVLMNDIERYILMLYDEKNIRACGDFAKSLEQDFISEGAEFTASLYAASYIVYVEFGRPPSDKLPPVDAIEKWIVCKGIKRPNKFKTNKQFAWSIAEKIKREGTSWYKKGGANFILEGIKMANQEKRLEQLSGELFIRTIETLGRDLMKKN